MLLQKPRAYEHVPTQRKVKTHRIVEKYKKEFPKGTPLVCACEKGRLQDVLVLVEGHDVEKTGMSVDEMVSKEGKNKNGLSYTPLVCSRERTV